MTQKLTPDELTSALAPLIRTGWQLNDQRSKIEKVFKFANFPEAFAFMTRSAFYAEKWDHHPDWSNSYNSVTVVLTTHDIGGLGELDIKLASKMDKLV